jgi:hypothetical protein
MEPNREDAVERLLPLVYDDLKRLAGSFFRRERPGHTLQPTALVHEAWLRLSDQREVPWQSHSPAAIAGAAKAKARATAKIDREVRMTRSLLKTRQRQPQRT